LAENIEEINNKINLNSNTEKRILFLEIISYVNSLVQENKDLKNTLKDYNKNKKDFKIIHIIDFTYQGNNSKIGELNLIPNQMISINKQIQSEKKSIVNIEDEYDINYIKNPNPIKDEINADSKNILNSDKKQKPNSDTFQFHLCDRFLLTESFLELAKKTQIILRIYNNSNKDYNGNFSLEIDNIEEIKEHVESICKIQNEGEMVKIKKKGFFEFKLIISTKSIECLFDINFSFSIFSDGVKIMKKFTFKIITSKIANHLNAMSFFNGEFTDISDEIKTHIFSLLKDGEIFMEKIDFFNFLKSMESDTQKIIDILSP